MAGKSRFSIAEKHIKSLFHLADKKVYSRKQIEAIYSDNNELWNLPATFNSKKLIDQLVKIDVLKPITIDLEGYKGKKELFIRESAEIFEISLALFPKSYLSHYTAAFVHQLTNQLPKTVYITFEQTLKPERSKTSELIQVNIDEAFSKPQRKSGLRGAYNDYVIVGHNGMYTNQAGVFLKDDLPVTNIERTLIDLTVRPNYGGGVQEVLGAYIAAKEKASINKLIGILNTLNFTYPYTQAIGFYLDRAGYNQKYIDALRLRNSKYDFYLTYDIAEKEYSKEWKLYYPKGL